MHSCSVGPHSIVSESRSTGATLPSPYRPCQKKPNRLGVTTNSSRDWGTTNFLQVWTKATWNQSLVSGVFMQHMQPIRLYAFLFLAVWLDSAVISTNPERRHMGSTGAEQWHQSRSGHRSPLTLTLKFPGCIPTPPPTAIRPQTMSVWLSHAGK